MAWGADPAGRRRRGWWLDLSAGPGGKTALLDRAGRWPTGAASSPASSRRTAPRSSPSATRGLPDSTSGPSWSSPTRPGRPGAPGTFTRVLADVPCTGLGALRRRPEARWRRDAADVEALHPLQRALLTTALDAAAPGGLVAYVTCSPHRRETVDVVHETLAERDDVEVVPAPRCCPSWPARTGRPRRRTASSSSCGRTGTARTRCSRRTCAAADDARRPTSLKSARAQTDARHAQPPVGGLRQPAARHRAHPERRRAARRRDGQPLRAQPDPRAAGGRGRSARSPTHDARPPPDDRGPGPLGAGLRRGRARSR